MSFILQHSSYLYFVLIALVVVLIGIWANRALLKAERRRQSWVERRETFEPIDTETPLRDPSSTAKRRGLESIQQRFHYIRVLVFSAVALGAFILTVMPLVSEASAGYVSLAVGTITLIIGIAARPFIENIIAGLVISFGQPIRVGDTVIVDGHYGSVEKVALTFTIIKVWDWRRYIVPNHQFINKEFENFTLIDQFQWAHIEFWVAPDADLVAIEPLVVEQARECRSYAAYEEPSFWVMETGKDSTRCWLAAWASSPADAWDLKHEMRMRVAGVLRKNGIPTHLSRYVRVNGGTTMAE